MNLTQEQQNIVNTNENIVINAVAGAGKTSTLIAYAKSKPKSSRILYLAFNRSVRLEAQSKFAQAQIPNVKVETAHSLALKHVVYKYNYKIKQNYKSYEIVALLKIPDNGEAHFEYIIANHVQKFLAYFCNSTVRKVSELNYLDVVDDPKAKTFVEQHYAYIEQLTRLFLQKMNNAEIEVTHDFYLKKFQLENVDLAYDYILFDEGQDASPTMLDVFLRQSAIKVIVGDSHQQIYGWRYAINSLEKVDFKSYTLSVSFRFNEVIAKIANDVMRWKNLVAEHKELVIQGVGSSEVIKSKAIIARTNVGLLSKAIEYVIEHKSITRIYFEGNINSYTYAEDGASLYDILNLKTGKKHLIRDLVIKGMSDVDELKEYIKKTDEKQMGMMLDIVQEYGNKIPMIIKKIKEMHVGDNEKDNAQIIFSTVHRSKGMEYDAVQLVNDFITKGKVIEVAEDMKGERAMTRLMEEVNMLYVALTRTKRILHIPEAILPDYKEKNNQVRILKSKDQDSTPPKRKAETKSGKRINELRKSHKDAYNPWTPELDDELTVMYCEGISVRDMMRHFGRTRGAINSRIKKLELKESYG